MTRDEFATGVECEQEAKNRALPRNTIAAG